MDILKHLIAIALLASASVAGAESAISGIVVNQRWPWSEKVDVDFTLSGDSCDVYATATWDSHPEPFDIGSIDNCEPGSRRITWDPSTSPFAGQTLTGFTVALTNAAVVRNYIIVDLVNGGCTYRSAPPEGGWTGEYKATKMVFRRIPAGTYTLGEPRETFERLEHWGIDDAAKIMNRRTVVFTNDFYVAIYKYTEAQHAYLTGDGEASFKPVHVSYNDLRGAQPSIDWPNTGYRVAGDSIVAKLRAKAGDGLVIDLCEEEQWEAAARAGTAKFWPNGGTVNDTDDALAGFLNEIAVWYGNTGSTLQSSVGLKKDNGWGLYDVVGLDGEWTLDTAAGTGEPRFGLPEFSENPTGIAGGENRILKSASGNYPNAAIYDLLPCRRQMSSPKTAAYSTRFCIHLSPLGSLSFEDL